MSVRRGRSRGGGAFGGWEYDQRMLVGRQVETEVLDGLLADSRDGQSATLVLRGEAGIGKSALLAYVAECADGMEVLRATGIQSETELAFAGLHQLLRPLLDRIHRLPEPQAAALRAAFALSGETTDDRFRVALGVLGLLCDVAEERPLLCLIDDAQWLDDSSTDALLFVARRLHAEGIVLLFAAREGDERRFEARDIAMLTLPTLDPDAAGALISGVCAGIAPAVRTRLVEQAAGNALALVELPTALSGTQLSGAEPLPETLPLTRDIEALFLERVRRLPSATQQQLLLVAADEAGSLAPVLRAAEVAGIGAEALGPAEEVGLVCVAGTHVELRHPLVRSAIYHGASSSERRAAHLALAEALSGEFESDRRAWHRAAAATGPDADVAGELERSADRTRLRGGYAVAATTFERAAELSVDTESKARRLVAAVSASWHAGQPARASALSDRATRLVGDPRLRLELDHVRGEIEHRCGALPTAGTILIAGVEAAGYVDSRKALEMLFDAASSGMQSGDYALVVEAGQRAAGLPRHDDERERFLADLLVGVGSLWLGTTASEVPLVLDVIARAQALDEPRMLTGAAMGASTVGDERSEAALLARALALARASGAVDSVTLALLATAVAGILGGRFAVATEAAEGLSLAREARLTGVASLQLAILTWFAAARGDDDECRTSAAEVAESASATGNALAHSIAEWGLALLDLSRGRPDESIARLLALGAAPSGHPLIVLMSSPDLVEACVRAGRDEHVRAAYGALEAFTQPDGPAWARALAARCRALLLHDASADDEFDAALRLHGEANRPFDHARTELLYGEYLRRSHRRRDARAHLRPALETFERLRAEPWAERARGELRASGETARKRDASTLADLTQQELQVARLASEGGSNKEIGAQLFLSPRTVEYHLGKVFTKLGIASRSDLIRHGVGTELASVP